MTTLPAPAPDAAPPTRDVAGVRRELARLASMPRTSEPTLAEILADDARLAQEDAEQDSTAAADLTTRPLEPRAPAPAPSLADLDAALDSIAAVEAQIASLHARRAGHVARACSMAERLESELVDDHDPTARVTPSSRRLELARRAVIADLATVLHLGEHAAGTLADHSETLTTKAPRTLAALSNGQLSWAHATQVAKHVTDLSPAEAARIESTVLAATTACTPAQLGARERRVRELVHPLPLDVRHADAASRRTVYLDEGRDGMAWLTAHLPTALAHAAYDRLTRTARRLRDDGELRTTGQLHADVLAALLLDDGTLNDPSLDLSATSTHRSPNSDDAPTDDRAGRPGEHAAGSDRVREPDEPPVDPLLELLCRQRHLIALARSVRPRVNVTVPVMTLLGRSDAPATLDGHVPIDPGTARQLAALAPSFRRILTHPETGVVLSVGRTTYTVPADLKALLEQRDVTCRFPGCRRPAHRSDLDHTTAWADGGTTVAHNLAHLCRAHHVTKHGTTWSVRQLPDMDGAVGAVRTHRADAARGVGGVLEWSSPTGRTHRTYPDRPEATLHGRAPSPGPHEPEPDDPSQDDPSQDDPSQDERRPPPF